MTTPKRGTAIGKRRSPCPKQDTTLRPEIQARDPTPDRKKPPPRRVVFRSKRRRPVLAIPSYTFFYLLRFRRSRHRPRYSLSTENRVMRCVCSHPSRYPSWTSISESADRDAAGQDRWGKFGGKRHSRYTDLCSRNVNRSPMTKKALGTDVSVLPSVLGLACFLNWTGPASRDMSMARPKIRDSSRSGDEA